MALNERNVRTQVGLYWAATATAWTWYFGVTTTSRADVVGGLVTAFVGGSTWYLMSWAPEWTPATASQWRVLRAALRLCAVSWFILVGMVWLGTHGYGSPQLAVLGLALYALLHLPHIRAASVFSDLVFPERRAEAAPAPKRRRGTQSARRR